MTIKLCQLCMKEVQIQEFNENGGMCESCAVQHFNPAELENIRRKWKYKSKKDGGNRKIKSV